MSWVEASCFHLILLCSQHEHSTENFYLDWLQQFSKHFIKQNMRKVKNSIKNRSVNWWKCFKQGLTSLFFLSAFRTSCLRPSSFCNVDSVKYSSYKASVKKTVFSWVSEKITDQSQRTQNPVDLSKLEVHVAHKRHRKMPASKSKLVLVLLLIG